MGLNPLRLAFFLLRGALLHPAAWIFSPFRKGI